MNVLTSSKFYYEQPYQLQIFQFTQIRENTQPRINRNRTLHRIRKTAIRHEVIVLAHTTNQYTEAHIRYYKIECTRNIVKSAIFFNGPFPVMRSVEKNYVSYREKSLHIRPVWVHVPNMISISSLPDKGSCEISSGKFLRSFYEKRMSLHSVTYMLCRGPDEVHLFDFEMVWKKKS